MPALFFHRVERLVYFLCLHCSELCFQFLHVHEHRVMFSLGCVYGCVDHEFGRGR